MRTLIANPVIAREGKAKAMLAVLDAAQIGGLVRKFVGAVAGNGNSNMTRGKSSRPGRV